MLNALDKPICLIGYPESSITQEGKYFVSTEFSGEILIMTPEEFMMLENRDKYQYMVMFTLDRQLREEVINVVDRELLDCVTYIHPAVVCHDPSTVSPGSFVAPFCTLMMGSSVGRHCIIETYCLLAHYSHLGDNCILHSGTMIAGKTRIGPNSVFNFRSSVLNALTLCGDIEVGAASTVTKDIVLPGMYVGTPARRTGNVRKFNV